MKKAAGRAWSPPFVPIDAGKAVLGCQEVLEGIVDLAYSIIGHQGQAERHQTATLVRKPRG